MILRYKSHARDQMMKRRISSTEVEMAAENRDTEYTAESGRGATHVWLGEVAPGRRVKMYVSKLDEDEFLIHTIAIWGEE